MDYEFGIRFRSDEREIEGSGSMMVKFVVADAHLAGMVRRTVTDVMRHNPTALFDGMIYYGSRETS